MGLLETEALVLRTYNLAEADKIVVCLTRRAGLIRAVAKGSRQLRSRFGAALEPFTLLNISCYQKEHQELISLRQTEILHSNFSLLGNPDVLIALSYLGDLVIEFSPPYQPNERLFRMVKACLEALSDAPTDLQAILRYFEVWLLKLEGFLPDLSRCGQCQRTLKDGEAVHLGTDLALRCVTCNSGIGYTMTREVHAQLKATHKLGPKVFAELSRTTSQKTGRELADFTNHIIGRVLERPPRVRLRI